VKAAFETRYNPPGFMKYKHANDLFNKKQGSMSVDDFCAQMQLWLEKWVRPRICYALLSLTA